jgi:hypothetical protein
MMIQCNRMLKYSIIKYLTEKWVNNELIKDWLQRVWNKGLVTMCLEQEAQNNDEKVRNACAGCI